MKKNANTNQPTFLSNNFLLHNTTAEKLYHVYAAHLPIIDYHNHLSPHSIASNKKFANLTEIWLKEDHYKWRAMRTLGISENLITGNASDEDKFKAWATCVPQTIRNPLFHWTQMELKNPFGLDIYLNTNTANEIYTHCNQLLTLDSFSTQNLLKHFKVQLACTTDDPVDDLLHHQQIADNHSYTTVLPSFRPDKLFAIANAELFIAYIRKLEAVTNTNIIDIDSLLSALKNRVEYFNNKGCRIADHGLLTMPPSSEITNELVDEFKIFISSNGKNTFSQPEVFSGMMLKELCKMYYEKGWIQQFHLGALRNTNTAMYVQLGNDSGFDSIGDDFQAKNIASFLNELATCNKLTKTIIYNSNPAYNEVFAAMIANFNNGSIKGKIQYGGAWWFLDQMDGIVKQLNALSNIGIISTFVGMLTDSRSFLSFSRHEYFRRILCNIFGAEMENGLLPNDEKWIGKIIQDICYYNAIEYFGVEKSISSN